MQARPDLTQELKTINGSVKKMTEQVKSDIGRAVQSICDRDGALARKVIDQGDIVDDMEDAINEACFQFLATQAPVAGDLRYTVSVMKMIRDLERIGDHCEDLAKYTIRLEKIEYDEELVDLPRMADMAAQMVSHATEAFLQKNLRLARKVWKSDEEVDELYRRIFEDQMQQAKQPGKTELCVSFAFIGTHVESIAHYATNICEEAVFVLEGELEMESV